MAYISFLPALIAIIITFKTKKLIPAMLTGVVIGSVLYARSFSDGIIAIGGYIVKVLADKGSAYTLGFLIAFGSLADLIKMAGGISGFEKIVGRWVKSERGVLGFSWLLSLFTFFDSSFHAISVSAVMDPLLKKVNGSKEKFAFILAATSLQLMYLMPIATGSLGYMVNLVTNNTRNMAVAESPYLIVVKSILCNFFSWSMLLIALGVTLFGLGFGKYRIGKAKGDDALTQAHVERLKEVREADEAEEYPGKSVNLIVPIAILILSTVFFFWWTGRMVSPAFFQALSNADFSASIFAGAILTLFLSGLFFLFQKISLAEIQAHVVRGAQRVVGLILILVLSWSLTRVTQDLGFNDLVSADMIDSIPIFLIPLIVFLIAGAISYTIGSSWATWALALPLGIHFAVSAGIDVSVTAGAVWAGGAVTDAVSPVVSRMAKISYGQHLTSVLPYQIAGILLSMAGYLILGLLL